MEITKGKAGITENSKGFIIMSPPDIGRHIAFVHISTQGRKVAKADAELITEAFNVANETGYSPGELADRNAELLEACKSLLSCIDSGMDVMESMDKGHQAIQKSTKHNYLLKL